MVSNLTKDEAKQLIENVVKNFTDDYKVIVAKRATNTRLDKKLTFGVTVKKEDANDEELFDELTKILTDEPAFVDIRSVAFLDNKTLKEDYAISVIVKI
ncbi:MAG: hypothetical protein C0625_07995 [Arcobacter sp.]|nr:MAG: hypothetical protein C0625_07995 [Arcobacter sp.]